MRYSQGICADGAAILYDGQPLTIEEILGRLAERDRLAAEIEELRKGRDDLVRVVADCRNAAGFGGPSDPMDNDGWRALGDPDSVPEFIAKQFQRAEARIAKLEIDAKRYRHMRDNIAPLILVKHGWYPDLGPFRIDEGKPERIDRMVDAALERSDDA